MKSIKSSKIDVSILEEYTTKIFVVLEDLQLSDDSYFTLNEILENRKIINDNLKDVNIVIDEEFNVLEGELDVLTLIFLGKKGIEVRQLNYPSSNFIGKTQMNYFNISNFHLKKNPKVMFLKQVKDKFTVSLKNWDFKK